MFDSHHTALVSQMWSTHQRSAFKSEPCVSAVDHLHVFHQITRRVETCSTAITLPANAALVTLMWSTNFVSSYSFIRHNDDGDLHCRHFICTCVLLLGAKPSMFVEPEPHRNLINVLELIKLLIEHWRWFSQIWLKVFDVVMVNDECFHTRNSFFIEAISFYQISVTQL